MTFPRSCLRFFHNCREATLLSLWGNKLVGRDQREMSNVVEGNKSGLIRLSRLFCVPALKHALADDQCYFDSEGVAMTTASIDFFLKNIFRVWGPGLYLFRPGRSGIIYATFYWTASYYLLKVGFIKRHGTQDDNPFISPRLGIH